MFEEDAPGTVEGRYEAMSEDFVAWLLVFIFFLFSAMNVG